MRVVLRLSGDAESSEGTLKTAELGGGEFTIGRDPSCDWSVSDGKQMMSRRHCILQAKDGRVLLTDISSNGTAIGTPSNRLVQGQPTPLDDTATLYLAGEHVRIAYECHAAEKPADTDDFWGVDELKRERERHGGRTPRAASDDLDLLGEDDPDRDNPLAATLDEVPRRQAMDDLLSLDDEPPRREAPPEAAPREDRTSFAIAAPAVDLFAVDDDEEPDDPFDDLAGGASRATKGEADLLSLDDAVPSGPAPRDDMLSLDDDDPPARGSAEPLSLDDASPPRPPADTLSLDDTPPPAAPVAREEPARQEAPPREPVARPQTTPPRAEAEAPPNRREEARPPAQPTGDADRTLAVLFAALGIPLDEIPPEKREAVAAEIGRSFRTMADGYRELLESRRDVKIALGLGATQVESGSNPLKFVRDAGASVDAILRPKASGFMSGVSAVEDSVRALQKHQVALVGGVKVSMKTALDAFDPATLEKKLTKKGLSQIIPMKRKAELWERFVENYAEFADEANDNIKRLIGKDLERLYGDSGGPASGTLDL